MLGITYIRKLFNMSMEDLATKLNVSKQTISKWENNKIAISKERLQQLENSFDIPQEYFQKELNEIDRLIIQKMKMENEIVEIEYEDTVVDEETGEECTVTRTYLDGVDEFYLQHITYEIKENELYENIKRTLGNCFNNDEDSRDGGLNDAWNLLEDFQKFADIMNMENVNRNTIRKILKAIYLSYRKGFDSDIFVKKIIKAIKEEEEKGRKQAEEILELTKDIDKLFK